MDTEKRRVLVVDDESGFTELLKTNLQETGRYDVRIENHGTRAAAAARDFKPDIVLLDVIMPDKSGGEVTQEFRDDPLLRAIPIVMAHVEKCLQDRNGGERENG